jgi:hypothetical protein
MAKIRIYRHEADGEDFPRMCMRCGRAADCDVPQTFAWMPAWANALILLIFVGLLGLVAWIIASITVRKTMRVVAPMCLRHAGHWRVRKMYVLFGLLSWIAFGVALVVFADALPSGSKGPVILGGIFGAVAWLISAALVMNGAIKASEIRDKGMDLVNVHRDFADAWNDAAE